MEQQIEYSVSVEEAGRRLGLSRSSAYELARQDGFPIVRVGKRILVPIRALERWLDEQAQVTK